MKIEYITIDAGQRFDAVMPEIPTNSIINKLIAGNGAYICSDCVRLCMNIVDEDLPQRTDPGKSAPSAP